MFGCNSVNPVYGSRIDRAQMKARMCFSRLRWACLVDVGSMLVNSVHPAVGSELAEAGPRFHVPCLPIVAEHPGGREREREWLPCSAQGSLASSYVPRDRATPPSSCCRLLKTRASVCSSASCFGGNIYRRLYIPRCRPSCGLII